MRFVPVLGGRSVFIFKIRESVKIMKTILFQGDSITDAARNRENDFYSGMGYPRFVSGEIGMDYPGEYTFVNKGISGNRIVDLYGRIKRDILNIKPDIMSILIGVNDTWHEFMYQNGVDSEKFFKIYSMLIEEVKQELPDIKIIILEPFVLKCTATEEHWEGFRKDVEEKAVMSKKVAEKYGLTFVPLMKLFDEAATKAPASEWLHDGVHPTAAGHELIKREWMKAFKML